jgi:hypothetical protein
MVVVVIVVLVVSVVVDVVLVVVGFSTTTTTTTWTRTTTMASRRNPKRDLLNYGVRSRGTPRTITSTILWVAWMSSTGFPSTRSKSAHFPTSIVP